MKTTYIDLLKKNGGIDKYTIYEKYSKELFEEFSNPLFFKDSKEDLRLLEDLIFLNDETFFENYPRFAHLFNSPNFFRRWLGTQEVSAMNKRNTLQLLLEQYQVYKDSDISNKDIINKKIEDFIFNNIDKKNILDTFQKIEEIYGEIQNYTNILVAKDFKENNHDHSLILSQSYERIEYFYKNYTDTFGHFKMIDRKAFSSGVERFLPEGEKFFGINCGYLRPMITDLKEKELNTIIEKQPLISFLHFYYSAFYSKDRSEEEDLDSFMKMKDKLLKYKITPPKTFLSALLYFISSTENISTRKSFFQLLKIGYIQESVRRNAINTSSIIESLKLGDKKTIDYIAKIKILQLELDELYGKIEGISKKIKESVKFEEGLLEEHANLEKHFMKKENYLKESIKNLSL